MATFLALLNFTDQGIRSVKDTTRRAAAARDLAKSFGIEMKEIYWTLGQYDLAVIFEGPDDATMTAFGLALGMAGNVRSETLRAFSLRDEPDPQQDALMCGFARHIKRNRPGGRFLPCGGAVLTRTP